MKKLLLIFLFIPLLSQGQMKITDHVKVNVLGTEMTYRLYTAKIPTSDWLIFLPGSGERGPADGSQLPLVEKHSYPAHAKGIRPGKTVVTGVIDFTFNMIVPQILPTAPNYKSVVQVLPSFLKAHYKANTIIVTGLSRGGYGAYDAILPDQNTNLIYAIVPVCAAGQVNAVDKYRPMRAWHLHGDKDDVVSWRTAKAFVDKYNALHPNTPIKWTLYPGVGHSSWIRAYSVKPGEDEVHLQIKAWFAEAASGSGVDIDVTKRLNAILHQMQNNLDALDSGIWHIRETLDSANHK